MKKNEPMERLVDDVANTMGIGPEEAESRKTYLGLTGQDVRILRELSKPLAKSHRHLMDSFYDDLLSFPATRQFLRDPETLERLKKKQKRYFDELISGPYDWDYVRNRLRVGLAHQKIGLEPLLYIGAYSKYVGGLLPEILTAVDGDIDRAINAIRALLKIVFFDLELALDTYMHADKQAIVALKEYAEKIVCTVPSGLVVLDNNCRVLSVNEFIERIYRKPHDNLKGQNIENLLPEIGIRERAMEVSATGRPQHGIVIELADINGEQKHFELSITPFDQPEATRGDDGAAHLLIVIEDLTEQEFLRSATQESDARIRTIMDNVSEGIVTIDKKGRIESFNAAAEYLFGYTAREVIGKNVKKLMPEPYYSEHDGYLASYLESGEKKCLGTGFREVQGKHKDGTVFPMELAISEMNLNGHRLFIGMLRDISERVEAQAQVNKLSHALEQSADHVVITDANGCIEYVNPAFQHVTGYSPGEVIGNTPSILKSGKHDEEFYKHLWQTIRNGDVYRDVFINKKKDGSLYYEEKTITPLKNKQGEITHFISTGKDITERMEAQERFHYLAHHDVLTGLPNRALFMDRLEQQLHRAKWNRRIAAVLFLDIDRFKSINDTLGHDLGDQLLISVAERLQQCVRDGDTVARFGGDEFVILLEDIASPDDIPAIANMVLKTISEPIANNGRDIFVTASIGISLYPADGDDASAIVRNADAAMYQAKEKGRNNYKYYTQEMNDLAVARLEMENKLRRAINRKEFTLHYQPQVSLENNNIIGVEALIRWKSGGKNIPPGEFVPLLEEAGLIGEVGLWVLQTACEQLREWQENGIDNVKMAINLSSRQFQDPRFVDAIKEIFSKTAVNPQSIELEITESILMENISSAMLMLRKIRSLGASIALDDFGTGYSSLSYLRRLEIDTLKIDRSFISKVTYDNGDAAIANIIISLAHSLNLTVVAEGVETPEQLQFLHSRKCGHVQGYFFCRPLPPGEVEALLRSEAPFPKIKY